MNHKDNHFASVEQSPKNSEKKGEDVSKKVAKVSEEMKKRGYDFEIRETAQEFIIALNKSEFHILKFDPFPLEFREGDGKTVKKASPPIQDVIKAIIMNPSGNIYETIYHSKEFKKLNVPVV